MKKKILRIKAKKQDESLENLSIEELDKMMARNIGLMRVNFMNL